MFKSIKENFNLSFTICCRNRSMWIAHLSFSSAFLSGVSTTEGIKIKKCNCNKSLFPHAFVLLFVVVVVFIRLCFGIILFRYVCQWAFALRLFRFLDNKLQACNNFVLDYLLIQFFIQGRRKFKFKWIFLRKRKVAKHWVFDMKLMRSSTKAELPTWLIFSSTLFSSLNSDDLLS